VEWMNISGLCLMWGEIGQKGKGLPRIGVAREDPIKLWMTGRFEGGNELRIFEIGTGVKKRQDLDVYCDGHGRSVFVSRSVEQEWEVVIDSSSAQMEGLVVEW